MKTLWTRDYTAWFLADTAGQATSTVRAFVFPIIILHVTGSLSTAGLAAALSSGLNALDMPLGGWWQDRSDRRLLLILWGLTGVLLFGMALVLLFSQSQSRVVWLACAMLFGVRSGLLGSVSNVLLRSVVSEELLPSAMALQDGRDAALDLAGAPLGGLLLVLGRFAPFLVGVILSALSLVCAFALNPQPFCRERRDGWGELWHGLRWLKSNRFSLGLAVFGTPIITVFNTILVIAGLDLAEQGVRPHWVGMVQSSAAMGVLVGTLLVAPLMRRFRGGPLVLLAFLAPGLSMLLSSAPFGPAGRILSFLPAFLLLPVGNAVVGSIQITIIPDVVLGRVFAAIGVSEGGIAALVMWLATKGLEVWGYHRGCWAACALSGALLISVLLTTGVHRIPGSDERSAFARSVA